MQFIEAAEERTVQYDTPLSPRLSWNNGHAALCDLFLQDDRPYNSAKLSIHWGLAPAPCKLIPK